MKYLKFLIPAFMILLIVSFFYPKSKNTIENTQIPSENEQVTQTSPDLAYILSNFFDKDLPISNLLISIDGEDIEISGILDKNQAEDYLNEQNLLDFKTKLALFALPQTLNVKLTLKASSSNQQFLITTTNIQVEDYSLDTNFVIYSLIF
ncbi:MAG: hypothetical protein R3Y09_04700 [Clostridia bacterium]